MSPKTPYTAMTLHWIARRECERELKIPPGPNNPVGAVWIGLSAEGYGSMARPIRIK